MLYTQHLLDSQSLEFPREAIPSQYTSIFNLRLVVVVVVGVVVVVVGVVVVVVGVVVVVVVLVVVVGVVVGSKTQKVIIIILTRTYY